MGCRREIVQNIAGSRLSIENSLHWVMDMTFRDGECRVRQDNAAVAWGRPRRRKQVSKREIDRNPATWVTHFLPLSQTTNVSFDRHCKPCFTGATS